MKRKGWTSNVSCEKCGMSAWQVYPGLPDKPDVTCIICEQDQKIDRLEGEAELSRTLYIRMREHRFALGAQITRAMAALEKYYHESGLMLVELNKKDATTGG